MANQQEQLMAEFVQWLPQNIAKFEGKVPEEIIQPIAAAQTPEEVVGVLNQLSQSEEGNQLVTAMFQAFQQTKTGLFKKGGKLEQLVRKCGGGTKFNSVLRPQEQHYVEQVYGPNGKVYIRTAPTRETLISNQEKDPNSLLNMYQGDYAEPHIIIEGNKNGITSVAGSMHPHFANLSPQDSTAAVNRAYALLKKANIKAAIPQKSANE